MKVEKGSYNVQEHREAALREEIKYLGLFSLENRRFCDKMKMVNTLSEPVLLGQISRGST